MIKDTNSQPKRNYAWWIVLGITIIYFTIKLLE